jgi:hypothetical protein
VSEVYEQEAIARVARIDGDRSAVENSAGDSLVEGEIATALGRDRHRGTVGRSQCAIVGIAAEVFA